MALSKIQAESMNLADTYAFTGTVSGAGTNGRHNLLATTTVTSAVADVSFGSTYITSTYKSYFLEVFDSQPTNDHVQVYMSLTTNNFSTEYLDQINVGTRDIANSSATTSSTFASVLQNASEPIRLSAFGAYSTGQRNVSVKFQIWNPTDTSCLTYWDWRILMYNSSGYYGNETGAGMTQNNDNVNGIRFKYQSGNIAKGTFKLYGITT